MHVRWQAIRSPSCRGERRRPKPGSMERTTGGSGDFFGSVPEAGLYRLKHVLHDWEDPGRAICEPASARE